MTDLLVDDLPQLRRATRFTLIGAVLAAGMGLTASFAATSLAAKDITDSATLATLAATTLSLGSALAAIPLGRAMSVHGRRIPLRTAWLIGSGGAATASIGVLAELYPLLVLGGVGMGIAQAANLAARYTAADLAEPAKRAREIGLVIWAGSLGAVMGPTVALGGTGWVATEILGIEELAGPFLMATIVFAVAAGIAHRRLRPDPLLVARQLGDPDDPAGSAGSTEATRPSLLDSFRSLGRHRLATIAVFAMAVGQGVMVSVMTVTPLHMDDGAHETRIIGLVISLHIVGMYFFSPVVGWLVDRLPTTLMVAIAGAVLFIGAETASHTAAEDSAGMFTGLLLVGVGWSFATIAGAALLTAAFPVAERASVQGAADFTMVAAGATGGLSSGVIVEATSFHTLSHGAAILALSLIAAALYPTITRVRPRRAQPATVAG